MYYFILSLHGVHFIPKKALGPIQSLTKDDRLVLKASKFILQCAALSTVNILFVSEQGKFVLLE